MPTTETIPLTASPVAAAPAAAVAEEPLPLYIPPGNEPVNEPESPESTESPEVESLPGLAPAVGSPGDPPPPKGMPREWREWVDDRLAMVSERHAGEAEAIRETVDAFVIEVRERFAETDRKIEQLAADFEAFKREVLRLIAASEKRVTKRVKAMVRKSERRMTKVVTRLIEESEGRLRALIRESEDRLRALIRESEDRLTTLIQESEGRLTTLVKDTQARADRRMDRMETRNNILFAALLAGVFGALGALVTAWMTGVL